jgi:hypothetical protein
VVGEFDKAELGSYCICRYFEAPVFYISPSFALQVAGEESHLPVQASIVTDEKCVTDCIDSFVVILIRNLR